MRTYRNVSLSRGALWVLVILGVTLSRVHAQDSLTDILTNHFPVNWQADVFRDQLNRKVGTFQIYFPVSTEQYVPVSAQLAGILSVAPEVRSPEGILVRVLNTICTPGEVPVPDAGSHRNGHWLRS